MVGQFEGTWLGGLEGGRFKTRSGKVRVHLLGTTDVQGTAHHNCSGLSHTGQLLLPDTSPYINACVYVPLVYVCTCVYLGPKCVNFCLLLDQFFLFFFFLETMFRWQNFGCWQSHSKVFPYGSSPTFATHRTHMSHDNKTTNTKQPQRFMWISTSWLSLFPPSVRICCFPVYHFK